MVLLGNAMFCASGDILFVRNETENNVQISYLVGFGNKAADTNEFDMKAIWPSYSRSLGNSPPASNSRAIALHTMHATISDCKSIIWKEIQK